MKPYMWQGKHPSRWDLYEDGVSSSILSTFVACREQFRLEVVEGWRAQHVHMAFGFGTCIHWCLQQSYTQKDPPGRRECEKLIERYEKLWKKERPNPSKKQVEQNEKVLGLAETVLPFYFERWAGDFPGHKYPVKHTTSRPRKWVALEERFRVEACLPEHRNIDPDDAPDPIPVVGTRDGLFVPTHEKAERTFDTKCLSVIKDEDIEDTLPFNLQQMLYLWARHRETGRAPSGVVMNIVRRPGQRRGDGESLKDFLKRVKKEVGDPRKWDHYFRRIEMDITSGEVKAWTRSVLYPMLRELEMWWLGAAPHFMNPNALTSKYGRCAMFEPIVNKNFSGCFQRKRGTIMNYQTEVA